MRWHLERLYPGFDSREFLGDFDKLGNLAESLKAEFAAFVPGTNDLPNLESAVDGLNDAERLIETLQLYAGLTLAVDAQNADAAAAMDRLMKLSIPVQMAESALCAYVGKLPNLDALIAQSALLTEHKYFLTRLRRDAAHLLDPAVEEAVLRMKLTGGEAWSRLRDTLDATLMIDFEQDSEVKKLPLSEIRNLAYVPDAETRKRAYDAELAAYPRMEVAMAACLSSIKGEALTMVDLRRFDSVLDWAVYDSHMDMDTLNALIAAMEESLPMFRRYFRAKAKALGHEGGLPFWDLFAPMGEAGEKITMEDARRRIVSVMKQFSDKMANFIDHAFEDEWIDSDPAEGKQGGAFDAGCHTLGVSFVMTNYDGSLGFVQTVAHELGHAYHDSCLMDASSLNFSYPMPLAETASIFNETLMTRTLLKTASGSEKLLMLDQELSDAAQVIVDILSRFYFEREVIERRKDHPLQPEELCEIMKDAQKRTYGDGLAEDALHPYMWACKSHYYSPDTHFYNFPYAFGLLFGKGVYAQYEKEGAAFVPKYDALLRMTSVADVKDVAASVGIDVTDIDFWRGSLAVIGETVREFEELTR